MRPNALAPYFIAAMVVLVLGAVFTVGAKGFFRIPDDIDVTIEQGQRRRQEAEEYR